jgi:hypothetical protein
VLFLAAKYSLVMAALSTTGAGGSAGATAATVSVAIGFAESVVAVLDSLALLHADERTSIPQEINKNFVFIFYNLIVIVSYCYILQKGISVIVFRLRTHYPANFKKVTGFNK